MGFWDFIGSFRRQPSKQAEPPVKRERPGKIAVGAKDDEERKDIQSYNNSNITFSGELYGYDYDSILRNKQQYIYDLYKL